MEEFTNRAHRKAPLLIFGLDREPCFDNITNETVLRQHFIRDGKKQTQYYVGEENPVSLMLKCRILIIEKFLRAPSLAQSSSTTNKYQFLFLSKTKTNLNYEN